MPSPWLPASPSRANFCCSPRLATGIICAAADITHRKLAEAVHEAGYGVATREATLAIGGMTCASCVGRVEKALLKTKQLFDSHKEFQSANREIYVITDMQSRPWDQREVSNNFTLNGIDNNDTGINGPSFRPSIDAIQEFKLLSGSYSAEYGRNSGGQVVVTTKSGTNQFHGTGYEFIRNQVLDARNFFLRLGPGQKIPAFKRNLFGGTVGGPIKKDKTFFFFGYEGLRLRQSVTALSTVPTEAMVRGDFRGLPVRVRQLSRLVTTKEAAETKAGLEAGVVEIVVGTHGRSLYILDDTQPLREFTAEVAAKDAHLFSIRPAYGRYHLPGWDNESGKGWFKGANPAEGALLTVWIREFAGEKFTVTIKNSHGHTMAKFEQIAAPGFNRFNWDLKLGKDYKVQYGGDDGDRFCASGEYTAELSYKDVKAKQTFKVTIEPGIRTHGTFAQ